MTDKDTIFCTAQDLSGTTAGSSVDSTDWIDLGLAKDLAGGGDGPVAEVIIATTFVGVGAQVTFLLGAVEEDGSGFLELDRTRAIGVAELVAGTATNGQGSRFLLTMSPQHRLPPDNSGDPRTHLRLRATVTGATVTQGAITAQLLPQVATTRPTKAYPAGW